MSHSDIELEKADEYTCKFCGKRQEGRKDITKTDLVIKVVPYKPDDWRLIDFDLWCGQCDPRKGRKDA